MAGHDIILQWRRDLRQTRSKRHDCVCACVRAGRKNVTMRSRYKNVISALMGFDWCAYLTMLRCTKLRTPGATTFGPWPCQPAGWKKCDNPLCVRKALPDRPTSSCWWLAPVSALSLFVFTALVRALQF
jgi:hypothetical protein